MRRTFRSAAALVAVSLAMSAAVVGLTSGPAAAAGWCNQTVWVDEVYWPLDPTVDKVRIPSTGQDWPHAQCELDTGAQGAAVKQLQLSLNTCYKENLGTDGKFGTLTKAALKRAQIKEGMSTADRDGRYGPRTRDAIAHTGYGGPSAYCRYVDGPGGLGV
ncbi:peptidoglycan-binding protein [Dactylosporangium siamense]|uniref:Peptidoglycan binding-like domain-containing protein n=1 Tax=Dactylosporangium siamense TaxID=685454 RepID=A0A919PIE0_9ACTN|nr:peptidoglycan-binding domain-containing protein [Dactylosporangium siamense]GIG43115.1 hypothetical protein Dsi01nite_011560 [Dactylosporangium siamense]